MKIVESDFYISTDKNQLDIGLVHDFLSNQSYWAKGRSRETIETSIANSLCFGVYNSTHQQVGFARVVSDFSVFAWLLDVFIAGSYRGNGLGKLLIKEIMAHHSLQSLKRWGLGTQDAHGLYKQFGFKLLTTPQNMMEYIVPKSM